jgi:hypothetical protein
MADAPPTAPPNLPLGAYAFASGKFVIALRPAACRVARNSAIRSAVKSFKLGQRLARDAGTIHSALRAERTHRSAGVGITEA